MSKPQIVYIHGGEAFDNFWSGWCSAVINYLKRPFKVPSGRWPDGLEPNLPEFEVLKLKMPGKYNAKYATWKNYFEAQFETLNDEVVLLGWSLGANFLAKYLSENEFPKRVKAVHLVAGCYGCPGGFELNKKFPAKLSTNVYLYHSKDDFVVDFNDFERYKAKLPKAKTHVFEDRNHFLQPEFVELMDQIKK